MTSRLRELARRKQRLIDQCAREREDLAAFYRHCRLPFGLWPTLGGVGRLLKGHPLLVAGASSLLLMGRARGLAKGLFKLWDLWRAVVPLWTWWSKRPPPTGNSRVTHRQ